jgi:two-component system CheB/CheR fusion protein
MDEHSARTRDSNRSVSLSSNRRSGSGPPRRTNTPKGPAVPENISPSANHELESSKEELQSLNEVLIALNDRLEQALDLQRTTSDDLRNVLYSTDVATLFLDTAFNIRLFTPATRSLFSVIPGDVGRPLADLNSLATDDALMADAVKVLETLNPIEKEIKARTGAWYIRRILPYRTSDNGVDGIVITFVDITERRRAADALEVAERQAQSANAAKSRFLAAASHDLRQPLQTLVLLQSRLANTVEGERAQKLVARLDETLGSMSGMLNALLDINQIEAGTVRAAMIDFPVDDLFDRMRDEFTYHAQAQGLAFRVVSGGLSIHSDPRLLEQMIRNFLSNALKYTRRGKVLLGCRRRGSVTNIEVWDTGVGIPNSELEAIFEEYHQLDNAPGERNRGLGLGLSIVQRLGTLLGHRIHARSIQDVGSVFSIEVMTRPGTPSPMAEPAPHVTMTAKPDGVNARGMILVVEDDHGVCELLGLALTDDGHRVTTAPDGLTALELVAAGKVRPDLILADYNLPKGTNGLRLIAMLRKELRREIPAVILTGDISTDTLREIAFQRCVHVNKPVKVNELSRVIEHLLPVSTQPAQPLVQHFPNAPSTAQSPIIFVVDDDVHVRDAIRGVLEDDGRTVADFPSCEAFLEAYSPDREACLVIDAYLPGMSGLELLRRLAVAEGRRLPAIMITGNSDVAMAVQAMKAGALDFIEKPIGRTELLASMERALETGRDSRRLVAWQESAATQLVGLTARQRQIMDMVLTGNASKKIAADLGISQRTVENHRASIMKKTGAKSLPALARLAITALMNGGAGDSSRGDL